MLHLYSVEAIANYSRVIFLRNFAYQVYYTYENKPACLFTLLPCDFCAHAACILGAACAPSRPLRKDPGAKMPREKAPANIGVVGTRLFVHAA